MAVNCLRYNHLVKLWLHRYNTPARQSLPVTLNLKIFKMSEDLSSESHCCLTQSVSQHWKRVHSSQQGGRRKMLSCIYSQMSDLFSDGRNQPCCVQLGVFLLLHLYLWETLWRLSSLSRYEASSSMLSSLLVLTTSTCWHEPLFSCHFPLR